MIFTITHVLAAWEYRVVFPAGWQWLVLVICAILMICAVKWRKPLAATIPILALAIAIFIASLWVLTLNQHYTVQFFGVRPRDSGALDRSILLFTSQCGGLCCVYYERELPASEVKEKNRTQPTLLIFQQAELLRKLYPAQGPIDTPAHPWPWYQKAGFQIFWKNYPADPNHETQIAAYSATVPHWFALLLCLPFPLMWFHRFRRRRFRLRYNLCLACGYDLRESPEKCPECGTVPVKPAIKAAS